MALGNPYRIKKPKEDVFWKGTFRPANEKGAFADEGLIKFRAVLTPTYFWLCSELAIPLKTIINAKLINKGKGIVIIYRNILSNEDESIFLCMLTFLGLHDKKRLEKFNLALQQRIENIEEIRREEDIETHEEFRVGCESCGSKDAAMVELGTFYCIGFYPFIGAYGWSPKRRYFCRKHAQRYCSICNLTTAIAGYLGFPGVFVAPYRVWKNISQVNKAFPMAKPRMTGEVLLGLLVPIAVVGYVLYEWSKWLTSP